MAAPQLELDFDAPSASLGRVFAVKTIDMGEFGNKTLLYFVQGDTVRVLSYSEFDSEAVLRFTNQSANPKD